jgi:hypothetical protein
MEGIQSPIIFLTKKEKKNKKGRNKKIEKNHLDGWLTGKKSSNT